MLRRLTPGRNRHRCAGRGTLWGIIVVVCSCAPRVDEAKPMPPAGLAGHTENPSLPAVEGASAAEGPLHANPGETIVTVGTTAFVREDFERALFLLATRMRVPPGPLSDDVVEALELPAFKQLLKRGLLYEEALRRSVSLSDAEVEKEVSLVLAQGGEGRPVDEVLTRMRTDRSSLARDVRIDGSIARLLAQLRQELPVVDNDLARRLYDEQPERWQQDDRVLVRQILVGLSPDAPLAEVEKARRRAEELRTSALEGGEEKFAILARQESDDVDTREIGGALGWVPRRGLLPDLSQAAFSLSPGQVSPVIRTERGFHLLFLKERQQRKVSFDDVREQILATERYLQARDQEQRLLADLEERTAVVVRVGPRHVEEVGTSPPLERGENAPAALGASGAPTTVDADPHLGGLPLPSKDNVLPGMFNPHAGELRVGGVASGEPELRLPARP
ncbi:MAG: peptidylprolyl isomerase [Myxococcota bacterium]